jgi:hypothetical protein
MMMERAPMKGGDTIGMMAIRWRNFFSGMSVRRRRRREEADEAADSSGQRAHHHAVPEGLPEVLGGEDFLEDREAVALPGRKLAATTRTRG